MNHTTWKEQESQPECTSRLLSTGPLTPVNSQPGPVNEADPGDEIIASGFHRPEQTSEVRPDLDLLPGDSKAAQPRCKASCTPVRGCCYAATR